MYHNYNYDCINTLVIMKRQEILNELKHYFKPQELVSPQVYNRFGADSFQFFSTDLLHTLLVIRKNINRPITINNWHVGGTFSQRGLRDNQTPIFKKKFVNNSLYLSGHVLGMAVDFDVQGLSAHEVRQWLVNNEEILPCKIRLEHLLRGVEINWVHLDVKFTEDNPKVYLFNI